MHRLLFSSVLLRSFACLTQVSRLLAGLLLVAATSVPAATYLVTSAADTGAVGTLRWAIQQSNANPDSTIQIAASVGTITLGGALPTMTAAMTIDGGTGTTVTGYVTNIFTVSGPTVSMKNLTFTNAGFADVTSGNLALENVSLDITTLNLSNGAGLFLSGSNAVTNVYGGGHMALSGGTTVITDDCDLVGTDIIGDAIQGTLQIGRVGVPGRLAVLSNYRFDPSASLVVYNGEVPANLYFDYATLLEKNGPDTVVLSGANIFGHVLNDVLGHNSRAVINGGTLVLGHADAFGQDFGAGHEGPNLTLNGGTLDMGIYNVTVSEFSGSAGAVILYSGGGAVTFTADQYFTTTYAGILQNLNGTLAFNKSGSGTLTLSGANTYTGATTISGGTLQLSGGAAIADISAVSLANAGGVTLALASSETIGSLAGGGTNGGNVSLGASVLTTGGNNASTTFAGVISGSGGLVKQGTGTLTLTGANTFSGGLAINGGTVSFGSSAALGSGGLSFDGGTLAPTADMVLTKNTTLNAGGGTIANASGYFTLNGNVSGSGDLTKTGAKILTLAGAHTYTGSTTVSAGILKFTANGATASAVATSGLAIASGAKVIFADSQTYAGNVTGAGVLEHEFSGTTILTGAASHTGGTNIIGGTIQVGNGGSSGSLAGNVALSSGGTLSFNRSDALTYSSVVTGTGSLAQLGSGTLTLTGINTYTGLTTVSAGTLQLSGSAASSEFTVSGSGRLSGTGTLGALTVNRGGTIAPGNSPGTLNAGNTTWNSGGAYQWEINNATGTAGTNWDRLNISGTLSIGATSGSPFTISLTSLTTGNAAGQVINFNNTQSSSYTFASASGGIIGFDTSKFALDTSGFQNAVGGGTWSLSATGNNLNLDFTPSAIPEPGAYAAMAGGAMLGLALWRRRRAARF